MKRILVPVDFSTATKAVVKTAIGLAEPGARMILLHGLVPPLVTTDYGIGIETLQQTMELAEKNARRQLEHLTAQLRRLNFVVTSKLAHGSPAAAIVEQARRNKAEAIVLGSHGHTAFYDLLVGSTTHAVIKKAPCPVVIVPPSRTEPRKKR